MTRLLEGKNAIVYGAGDVILAITGGSSAGTSTMIGGTGPADAATEVFLRYLAKEIGPRGVRVVGLWTAGVPETFGLADDTNEARRGSGRGAAEIDAMLGPMTNAGPRAPARPGRRRRGVPRLRPRGWHHRHPGERHLRALPGLTG